MTFSRNILVAITATILGLGASSQALAITPGYVASNVSGSAVVGSNDARAINTFKEAKAEYVIALNDYKAKRSDYKAAKVAYKVALTEYKAANRAYSEAKKVIGKTFRDAVASAKGILKTELSSATDAEQKLAAKNKFATAKAQAASNRASALMSLGTAPVKPIAPVAPVKPTKPWL